MKLLMIDILIIAMIFCTGSVMAEKTIVESLGFILPHSPEPGYVPGQPVSAMFETLKTRISYDFNRQDEILDLPELRDRIALIGGDLIGRPLMTGEWGLEIEAGFISQTICRIAGPDGSVTERPSNPDESPGMHLIVTPRKIPDDSTRFSLDYNLAVALITGSPTSESVSPGAQCPELIRYQFTDQIVVESGQWTIIGLLILENPGTQTLHEVWVLTRLRVEF